MLSKVVATTTPRVVLAFFFGFEPQTLRQEMRDDVPDKNTEVEEQMLDGSLRKSKKRPCFVEAIHVQVGRTHAMAWVVDQRHGPIVRLLNGNIVALPHHRQGLSSLDFITWFVLQRHQVGEATLVRGPNHTELSSRKPYADRGLQKLDSRQQQKQLPCAVAVSCFLSLEPCQT